MYNTPRKENIKSRDYHVTPAITTVDKSYNTGDSCDYDIGIDSTICLTAVEA